MNNSSKYIKINDLNIHYIEEGNGPPILLLHGWPTSAYLWRNIIPHLSKTHRVIAIDLPGFGQSDKPLDVSYSFRFFDDFLTTFLDALNIQKVSLGIHDFGGPVGLFWSSNHAERVEKMIVLNTLVYPQMSWGVVLFISMVRLPLLRTFISSPLGLKTAMRIGVANSQVLTDAVIKAVQEPFQSKKARLALLRSGTRLHPKGFEQIEAALPTFSFPVRVIYGEKDWILPDIAKTVRRITQDLPSIKVTALPNCGHFLQEEEPDQIGQLMADFLNT